MGRLEVFVCLITLLTSLDLSGWDTGNVTDMWSMFYHSGLTSLDLSGWDTGNVIYMSNMFARCSKLTKIYVSSEWSTSSVTSYDYMFKYCTSLVGGNGTKYNSNYTGKYMLEWILLIHLDI